MLFTLLIVGAISIEKVCTKMQSQKKQKQIVRLKRFKYRERKNVHHNAMNCRVWILLSYRCIFGWLSFSLKKKWLDFVFDAKQTKRRITMLQIIIFSQRSHMHLVFDYRISFISSSKQWQKNGFWHAEHKNSNRSFVCSFDRIDRAIWQIYETESFEI